MGFRDSQCEEVRILVRVRAGTRVRVLVSVRARAGIRLGLGLVAKGLEAKEGRNEWFKRGRVSATAGLWFKLV
jgi:hypothetical protein